MYKPCRPSFCCKSERPAYDHQKIVLDLYIGKPDEASINFDFEMNWSSEVPLNKAVPSKVLIEDRCFSSVVQIGQKLMPQAEINQDVFVGRVWTGFYRCTVYPMKQAICKGK